MDIGEIYEKIKDYYKANQIYENCIKNNPNYEKGYMKLGHCYLNF